MINRHTMVAAVLSLAAALATPALAVSPVPPPAVNLPAASYLEQAYHSTWSAIKTQYPDADKLSNLDEWEHKFDGKLHAQKDLDQALDDLLVFTGNPSIRLLSPSQVADQQARLLDQKLSFGLQATLVPAPAGGRQSLHVSAASAGPAQQAGILDNDVVESVNNIPADRLTDDQVRTLNLPCQLGEQTHIKLARRTQPVIVSCGPAPIAASDSFRVGLFNFPAAGSSNVVTILRIAPSSLDDTRLREAIRQALTGPDADQRAVLFDLRGTDGTDFDRAANVAALFMQQGTVSCETPHAGPLLGVCHAVDNKKPTTFPYDPKFLLASFKSHNGPLVVLISAVTSGSALNLAAALQSMGAKVITTGAKTRAFDDEMVTTPLLGDPGSRSITLPNFHITQAPNLRRRRCASHRCCSSQESRRDLRPEGPAVPITFRHPLTARSDQATA